MSRCDGMYLLLSKIYLNQTYLSDGSPVSSWQITKLNMLLKLNFVSKLILIIFLYEKIEVVLYCKE